MDTARLLPVVIANLRTSQGFLDKLVTLSDRVSSDAAAAGAAHEADEEAKLAVALLARMTDAVLSQVEQSQRQGGRFSAHEVLAAALGPVTLPDKEGADIQRMRVIMDLCLQQGDIYRRKAFFQASETTHLRTILKDVYADLSAVRTILDK